MQSKAWWDNLFAFSNVDEKSFSQLMTCLAIVSGSGHKIPVEPEPTEVSVGSLAEKWAFQLKWGRSLLKQQSCLTTEEQQRLKLPELPLKNEGITIYLEAHKALCKKRTWATSCWMSIATLFLFSPSNLSKDWKKLANSRLSANIGEIEISPKALTIFLKHLQDLDVIGPSKPLHPKALAFLRSTIERLGRVGLNVRTWNNPINPDYKLLELPDELIWLVPVLIEESSAFASFFQNRTHDQMSNFESQIEEQIEKIDQVIGQFGFEKEIQRHIDMVDGIIKNINVTTSTFTSGRHSKTSRSSRRTSGYRYSSKDEGPK